MFIALSTAVCTRSNLASVFNAPVVCKLFLIHAVGAGKTKFTSSLKTQYKDSCRLVCGG